MQTCPYRNDRIITVIQELYFTGGSTSFVLRFDSHFPIHNGTLAVTCEIPLPMVCLVATGVSLRLNVSSMLNSPFFLSCMLPSISGRRVNKHTLTSVQPRL